MQVGRIAQDVAQGDNNVLDLAGLQRLLDDVYATSEGQQEVQRQVVGSSYRQAGMLANGILRGEFFPQDIGLIAITVARYHLVLQGLRFSPIPDDTERAYAAEIMEVGRSDLEVGSWFVTFQIDP